MSKKNKQEDVSPETEVFEMIELAIEDVEVLERAFRFIDALCREANGAVPEDDLPPPAQWH